MKKQIWNLYILGHLSFLTKKELNWCKNKEKKEEIKNYGDKK